jgi:stage II sporulation protein AA (anti-sigma F factor antagonist)
MRAELEPEEIGFSIAMAQLDGEVKLTLRGEIDLLARDQLGGAVDVALRGSSRLVLDMRDVSFLDSTGIGAIARAVTAGSPVSVLYPQAPIRRTLAVSGIDKYIQIVGGDHKSERTDDGTRQEAVSDTPNGRGHVSDPP